MRILISLLLFLPLLSQAQLHCGYDFTSYVVLHVHEEGKKENIPNLQITLVDGDGIPAVNSDNRYSWNHTNESLRFTRNYLIGADGKPAPADVDPEGLRWFFPFAKDTYFLSVTNEFPADDMQVEIVDPSGQYEIAVQPLYAYNMYVLCTTQAQQAMQFGRRTNKPLQIVLKKK